MDFSLSMRKAVTKVGSSSTAKAVGVTILPTVIGRADEAIE